MPNCADLPLTIFGQSFSFVDQHPIEKEWKDFKIENRIAEGNNTHDMISHDKTAAMPHYSIVLIPSGSVIKEVAAIKLRLKEAIGWYHSVHAQAHITFNLFAGGELTLMNWKHHVQQFAARSQAFNCCLNRTGHFSNGAFFLAPDESSRLELISLMKAFHRAAPKGGFGKSTQPHVSIGRKLSEEQLQIGKELVGEVNLSFICDNLTIRQFDPQESQYKIIERVDFCKKKE